MDEFIVLSLPNRQWSIGSTGMDRPRLKKRRRPLQWSRKFPVFEKPIHWNMTLVVPIKLETPLLYRMPQTHNVSLFLVCRMCITFLHCVYLYYIPWWLWLRSPSPFYLLCDHYRRYMAETPVWVWDRTMERRCGPGRRFGPRKDDLLW